MGRVETQIDNVSPLIRYDSGWLRGNYEEDTQALQYSHGGTFQVSSTYASTASFSFNGTDVTVFGARRSNHGLYSVTFDNKTSIYRGDALPEKFKEPLFSADNVVQGMHHVVIKNIWDQKDPSRPYLDIDYITWKSKIGDDKEVVEDATIQDSESAFTYAPATSWSTNFSDSAQFNKGTGHQATSDGALATLRFSGDSVSIFGTVGPSVPTYSVQLDDKQPPSEFNATNADFFVGVLLYHADNLGPGNHTVMIANKAAVGSASGGIAIDYAIVSNVPSVSKATQEMESAAKSGNPNPQPPTPKKQTSGALIAGIVVGALAVVAILVGLFFLLRGCKQKKNKSGPRFDITTEGPSFGEHHQVQPFLPFPTGESGATSHRSQLTESHEGITLTYGQAASAVPLDDLRGSVKNRYHGGSLGPNAQRPLAASSQTMSDLRMPAVRQRQAKGQPLTIPTTTSTSLGRVSEAELNSNRLVVPGRVQDFGPMRENGDVDSELLPPNYTQAVQPYDQR